MLMDVEKGKAICLLVDEEGTVLAGTRGYPELVSDYPGLQDFLRMWHRVWPRSRMGWPKYEREIAGRSGQSPLKLTAAPMLLAAGDRLGELSNQLCAMLISVSVVTSNETPRDQWARFALTEAEQRVAAMVAEGEAPSVIASQLGLSIYTVRSHMNRKTAVACSRSGGLERV